MHTSRFAVFLLCMLLLSFSACETKAPSKLGLVDSFTISASEYEEEYQIEVFFPHGVIPTTPIPVLYLMDGFWWFEHTANTVKELHQAGEIPEVMLVGLDYADGRGPFNRFADLSYPREFGPDNRDARDFHRFLTQELVPEIESRYTCDTTERTLLGHSLGGYFSLYSIFGYADSIPLSFQNYVAISNTIMLEDNFIFDQEAEVASALSDLPIKLYLSVGSLEGTESNVLHQKFHELLEERNYPSLQSKFEVFPTNHGANSYVAFKNGIQYVFD